ncbi:MAG: hypothetical protein IPO05_08910 [Flavobacteriales bacterium]|nr:hypothetical protein [Flavobacteriales bacterium]
MRRLLQHQHLGTGGVQAPAQVAQQDATEGGEALGQGGQLALVGDAVQVGGGVHGWWWVTNDRGPGVHGNAPGPRSSLS